MLGIRQLLGIGRLLSDKKHADCIDKGEFICCLLFESVLWFVVTFWRTLCCRNILYDGLVLIRGAPIMLWPIIGRPIIGAK